MMLESMRIWASLEDATGEDVGFTRGGCFFAANSQKEFEKYEHWVRIAAEHDIDTRLISGPELKQHVQGSAIEWLGAMYTPSDGPRTGYFRETVNPLELLGEQGARAISDVFAPDHKLTWQLYVPDSYDARKPAGVMVYVSPTKSGVPKRGWKSALDERNMIWIAALNSGNNKHVTERSLKAIFATTYIAQNYAIDIDRVYVSGFSGGGKTVARIARSQPDLFKGALYICGVEFWQEQPPKIDQVRDMHHVFLTGTNDFNRQETKQIRKKYQQAGVAGTELIVVRSMSHELPPTKYFAQAIDYLDSRN